MPVSIDSSWTLFLDRDGVINEKLDDAYVQNIDEFQFIDGALEAINYFSSFFARIIVVTNQQGIGKGIMTHEDLKEVHAHMRTEIEVAGGKLDAIYYCPELAAANAPCRKPNTGMPEDAKKDFPQIDFEKSIMVGDSFSDIEMGNRLDMYTVFISDSIQLEEADLTLPSISELANWFKK